MKCELNDRHLTILNSCRSEMAQRFPHLEIDANNPVLKENKEALHLGKALTFQPTLKRVRSADTIRPVIENKNIETMTRKKSSFLKRPSTGISEI